MVALRPGFSSGQNCCFHPMRSPSVQIDNLFYCYWYSNNHFPAISGSSSLPLEAAHIHTILILVPPGIVCSIGPACGWRLYWQGTYRYRWQHGWAHRHHSQKKNDYIGLLLQPAWISWAFLRLSLQTKEDMD